MTIEQEESKEDIDYGELLYKLYIELHPVYSSTSGPYGGVGGQAMTQWCHVKDPRIQDDELLIQIEQAVGRWARERSES